MPPSQIKGGKLKPQPKKSPPRSAVCKVCAQAMPSGVIQEHEKECYEKAKQKADSRLSKEGPALGPEVGLEAVSRPGLNLGLRGATLHFWRTTRSFEMMHCTKPEQVLYARRIIRSI